VKLPYILSFLASIWLFLKLSLQFDFTHPFLSEGGGNNPAPAVPLVALGTQNGTIEVVDVVANAVSVSFAVHNSTVRGLRWLGNSRFVSFSYNQVLPCSDNLNSLHFVNHDYNHVVCNFPMGLPIHSFQSKLVMFIFWVWYYWQPFFATATL
jgi:hypothetical protein